MGKLVRNLKYTKNDGANQPVGLRRLITINIVCYITCVIFIVCLFVCFVALRPKSTAMVIV